MVCAGTMSIRRGVLKFVSDVSATYPSRKGDKKPLKAVAEKLKKMRADMSKMKLISQWDL